MHAPELIQALAPVINVHLADTAAIFERLLQTAALAGSLAPYG